MPRGSVEMSGCLSLVSGDCLLAALLSRGEHTCSFYVSLFYLFLGTAPTNVIEWLTVLQAAFLLVFTPFDWDIFVYASS